MLFITNRIVNEGHLILKKGEEHKEREVSFDLDQSSANETVLFCQRPNDVDDDNTKYTEIGSKRFFEKLRDTEAGHISLYIHGFSNLPEPHIFPRTKQLQKLLNDKKPGLVQVIPLIWPCDNDFGAIKDYWDDQQAADSSAFAFARVLEKFMAWRDEDARENDANGENPCRKRINVLAHSMGNRVLRQTLAAWAKYHRNGGLPLLFRNTFLVAADIVNESLERGRPGNLICQSSRNVSVYYASDDLALRASKVSNLKNKVASRRLGHSGPENLQLIPRNVYSIDCDEVNSDYDLKGHSYFLYDKSKKKPGLVFEHIYNSVKTGRVHVDDEENRTHVIDPKQVKKKKG